MEVPPVADIISPEFAFYSETILWFGVGLFFQEASLTLTRLTNSSMIHLWAAREPVSLQVMCAVPTSVSVCLSPACAVVDQ